MRKVLILIAILASTATLGQRTKFAQLVNQMYFDIFDRGRPDDQIRPFIKKYLPGFLETHSENAGWAYTLGEGSDPSIDTTIHTFCFTKHPLIKSKFLIGCFDLKTHEKKGDNPLLYGWELSFTFESEAAANACFDDIMNLFEPVIKDKVVFERNKKKIAQITDKDQLSDMNCMEFILTPDELYENRYKIYFHTSRIYEKGSGIIQR